MAINYDKFGHLAVKDTNRKDIENRGEMLGEYYGCGPCGKFIGGLVYDVADKYIKDFWRIAPGFAAFDEFISDPWGTIKGWFGVDCYNYEGLFWDIGNQALNPAVDELSAALMRMKSDLEKDIGEKIAYPLKKHYSSKDGTLFDNLYSALDRDDLAGASTFGGFNTNQIKAIQEAQKRKQDAEAGVTSTSASGALLLGAYILEPFWANIESNIATYKRVAGDYGVSSKEQWEEYRRSRYQAYTDKVAKDVTGSAAYLPPNWPLAKVQANAYLMTEAMDSFGMVWPAFFPGYSGWDCHPGDEYLKGKAEYFNRIWRDWYMNYISLAMKQAALDLSDNASKVAAQKLMSGRGTMGGSSKTGRNMLLVAAALAAGYGGFRYAKSKGLLK